MSDFYKAMFKNHEQENSLLEIEDAGDPYEGEVNDYPTNEVQEDNSYMNWFIRRLDYQYKATIGQHYDAISETSDWAHGDGLSVFTHLAQALAHQKYASLKDLSDTLGQLVPSSRRNPDATRRLRVVFHLVGHLTCLYSPWPTSTSANLELQTRGTDGQLQPGKTWTMSCLPVNEYSDKPLGDLLRHFGGRQMPMPRPSRNLSSTNNSPRSAPDQGKLKCLNLNYYTLCRLLRINFVWVDNVCQHLDFNAKDKTLCLFRFPSFCAMLATHGNGRSFLCQFFNTYVREDVTDNTLVSGEFFAEVLFTYRLIFGQNKHSSQAFTMDQSKDYLRRKRERCKLWQKFRRLAASTPSTAQPFKDDPLLLEICGKHWTKVDLYEELNLPNVKNTYSAEKDFPYLGEKLEHLHSFVEHWEPDSWGGLWRDRRYLRTYYSFRIVALGLLLTAVFGLFSLGASVAQTWVSLEQVCLSSPPASRKLVHWLCSL